MKVFNTLTNAKEEFISQTPGKILMYVCGITSYDTCHLGHARCYVTFDTIRRYVTYRGYEVVYIQNFTDIDDKIITRSRELNLPWTEVTEKYITEYFHTAQKLNILPATKYPRVTENINLIIEMISRIINNGYAYVSQGNVYFSVRKFNGYGKLSNRNVDELLVGARVEPEETKTDPLDFALWKKAKPGEPNWDSPWGTGRPGWHIECSAMATKYLHDTIDIHGGGQDLIFPHHENEIAQSESATGKLFVRYWIHNGFVTLNKEKMSKSTGNFFTLTDIFSRFDPSVVRLFLLSNHYRTPVDFSEDKLIQYTRTFHNLLDTLNRIRSTIVKNKQPESGQPDKIVENARAQFISVMDDDFNTAEAMGIIFSLLNTANQMVDSPSPDINLLKQIDDFVHTSLSDILGIRFSDETSDTTEDTEIEALVRKRTEYRHQRNWTEADRVRKILTEKGVTIEDTPAGTRWWRKQ